MPSNHQHPELVEVPRRSPWPRKRLAALHNCSGLPGTLPTPPPNPRGFAVLSELSGGLAWRCA
eukprot:4120431-Alexandrium_andersonii.AAC.1